ncbi:MAG: response regulator transcription factor [Clostridia bacterium]
MSDKVLIVDDDVVICKMLEKVMDSNDLQSSIANSGNQALQLLQTNTYDVILMDVMMDDMEGFDVVKKIRERNITTPIIIISGKDEDYDVLYGLNVGADDYITKPFRPVVIGAKVKALIRRDKNKLSINENFIELAPFKYNMQTLRFYKNDKEIDLSSKENNLILLFLKNPNQVFTKEMIYEHVWGNTVIVDDNTIMVYINRLRNKIEDDAKSPKYILTVRGVGYRFQY